MLDEDTSTSTVLGFPMLSGHFSSLCNIRIERDRTRTHKTDLVFFLALVHDNPNVASKLF